MTEPGKRVNVRIPAQLYSEIEKSEMTVTEAIVQGLETIFKKDESISLDDILKLKDEALMSSQARITSLEDQLKVKDEQLSTRDKQIEKINETMNAQSVHIQTLINQKAIEAPAAEKKKPFWKFW
jgi:hypothetical protein